MATQTKNYFSHDYGARIKLADMRRKCGLEGVGFYWCLVEILHEEGGSIKESLIEGLAFDYRIDAEKAMSIVKDFGLFTIRKGRITNDRVTANIEKKMQVSQARRGAAEQRWGTGDNTQQGPQQAASTPQEAPQQPSRYDQFMPSEKEMIARGRGILDAAFERWECPEGDPMQYWDDTVHPTRKLINNILDRVCKKPTVRIDGENIRVIDLVQKLTYFAKSLQTREQLEAAIAEVNIKVEDGVVKNKENYLISTLYKIAVMNGAE